MSVKYICDVCGGEYRPEHWAGTDRISLLFPRHSVGDVGETSDDVDEMDVCSWECVNTFSGHIVSDPKEGAQEEPSDHTVSLAEHMRTHTAPTAEPEPEKKTAAHRMVRLNAYDTSRESPDKNFDPRENVIPGMKVDGRPV